MKVVKKSTVVQKQKKNKKPAQQRKKGQAQKPSQQRNKSQAQKLSQQRKQSQAQKPSQQRKQSQARRKKPKQPTRSRSLNSKGKTTPMYVHILLCGHLRYFIDRSLRYILRTNESSSCFMPLLPPSDER